MSKTNLPAPHSHPAWQIHPCSILLLGLILAAFPGAADTVTSVSCATPTAPLATGASTCDAAGLYGYTQGNVSTNISLPATAADAATITANSSVSALQTGVHGISQTATAQASANIGIIFDTTGSLRNGLLELSFLQNGWTSPINGYMSESLSIGSYSVNPNGSSLSSVWIPIQLGSQFGFDYQQSIAAIGSSISGLSRGDIDSQISLLAFEANGTTAVQLYDPPGGPGNLLTPEPASLGLMGLGLLSAALLSKFRT
jgi:hypothetical protein